MCVRQSSQLYFFELAFEFPGLLPVCGAADKASRLAAASVWPEFRREYCREVAQPLLREAPTEMGR
eukprot:2943765-Prorocentrum_lima.AAC.1